MKSNDLNPSEITAELNRLTGDEVEGGYRALCAAMLMRAAQELCTMPSKSQEGHDRKQAAKSWLYSGTGEITFQEACDALNLASGLYLRRLKASAENMANNPNNRAVPNKFALSFGSMPDALSNDHPQAGADHPGVVADCASCNIPG